MEGIMDRYVYPALFDPAEEEGYTVTFPDLPGCITEGDNMEEALRTAEAALRLHLYGMEEDREVIPQPSRSETIDAGEGFVSLVTAWMPLIREQMNNRAVKKTLTIPKWLNDEAEKAGVNFSQLLQDRFREMFGTRHTGRA